MDGKDCGLRLRRVLAVWVDLCDWTGPWLSALIEESNVIVE